MKDATDTRGGLTGDPAAALRVTGTDGCCGNPAQDTTVASAVTAASPCCGTAADAAGGCCGTAAKAEAVTSGAGCCG